MKTMQFFVPTLNRPKEIKRLEESFMKQELPEDWEISFTKSIQEKPRSLPQIYNLLIAGSQADVMCILADHLEFQPGCIQAIAAHFEEGGGVLGLNICNADKVRTGPRKCVTALGESEYYYYQFAHTAFSRDYLNEYFPGYPPYCPEYWHFHADSEFGAYAESIGQFTASEDAKVFTHHPNYGSAERDKTYDASRVNQHVDTATFTQRIKKGLVWGQSFDTLETLAEKKRKAKKDRVDAEDSSNG